MKKTGLFAALVTVLAILSLPCTSVADKSFNIHLPQGGLVNLRITTCALKSVRIHNFDFSENGETFSLDAAPNGSKDSMQSISIDFHVGSTLVQSELVTIGPGRTEQQVYCPDSFDQIVIGCFGY